MNKKRDALDGLGEAADHVERVVTPIRDIAATGQRTVVRVALVGGGTVVALAALVIVAVTR